MKTLSMCCLGAVLALSASTAEAKRPKYQPHALSFAQAGASLEQADMQTRILFASVKSPEFDLVFTKSSLEQIKLGLAHAKRNLDRAETLLPDNLSQHADKIQALRDRVVASETQRDKLEALIIAETKALTSEEEEEEEVEEAPPTDWRALEAQTGWLSVDIKSALTGYGKLGRMLKVVKPPKVKKPRGKRE